MGLIGLAAFFLFLIAALGKAFKALKSSSHSNKEPVVD